MVVFNGYLRMFDVFVIVEDVYIMLLDIINYFIFIYWLR